LTTNRRVDIVFENLLFRKVYHLLGGLLITGLLIAVRNRRLLFVLGLLYLIAFWIFGKRVSFAMMGLLLLGVVTASTFACAGSYLAFTIGDGAAAIVGSRFGWTTWPWHRRKTIVGTMAFFLTSFLALALFISRTTFSSSEEILLLALFPAAIGAAVECMPITAIRDRKPDDNLLVILSTGLLIHGLAQVLQLPITV